MILWNFLCYSMFLKNVFSTYLDWVFSWFLNLDLDSWNLILDWTTVWFLELAWLLILDLSLWHHQNNLGKHCFHTPVSGSFPKGSTQLSFVLTRAAEGPISGSGGSASPCDCICDYNWDCIWLNDNISCRVTFSVTESSNWSQICCINCCRSSGAMEEDV